MRADIQRQIAPTVASNERRLNDAEVNDTTAVQRNADTEVDFKSLLLESNKNEVERLQRMGSGDLSGAESYEDFLDQLAQQTEQKNAPKNTMDKDDFLTLFVTQLQQQDPLNPKDGTEMAAQLAQFNSLEQMMNVNKTLEGLVEAQDNQKTLQYLNFVGKQVSIDGGKVALEDGKTNPVVLHSNRELGRATLVVKDSAGKEVHRAELGVLGAGKHDVHWDGTLSDGLRASDGVYGISVEGKNANGESVEVDVKSRVTIKGVDLEGEKQHLYTEVGPIEFSEVKAVGERGFLSTVEKAGENSLDGAKGAAQGAAVGMGDGIGSGSASGAGAPSQAASSGQVNAAPSNPQSANIMQSSGETSQAASRQSGATQASTSAASNASLQGASRQPGQATQAQNTPNAPQTLSQNSGRIPVSSNPLQK